MLVNYFPPNVNREVSAWHKSLQDKNCFLFISELFEGDIVLDKDTVDIVLGKNKFDAVKSDARKWPKAVVPYAFASNFGK